MTTDIRSFWESRTSVDGPRAARFHGEHDDYDLAAIARLGARDGRTPRVLDLGCGTCVMANRTVEDLGWTVHAVDYVPGFLEHAADDPRLTTEQGEATTYVVDETFDLVVSFGVITYLEDAAGREAMYRNCASMLAPGGVLLVKAQFGVEEEVVVDTHSEALGSAYRAVYPQIDDEVERLSQWFHVTVEDPFPPSFSPWPNTHFHYLVARPVSA